MEKKIELKKFKVWLETLKTSKRCKTRDIIKSPEELIKGLKPLREVKK